MRVTSGVGSLANGSAEGHLYSRRRSLYVLGVRRRYVRLGVGFLVVAAFASVGYLLHTSLQAQKSAQDDHTSLEGMLPEAVQWIQNFHRIEIRDGKKAWELIADEAQYLQEREQVVVRNPRTTLYMKDGEKVTVSGNHGTVEFANGKDLRKAVLHDNVEVHLRDFVIRADEAVYERSTEKIVATGPVTIVGTELKVAGNDMTVYVKDSRFELGKSVRVTLLPKAPQGSRRS
jgi:LPS export ABC transporter protein LptC